MTDFITFVKRGSPAEKVFRRVCENKIRPGAVTFVSEEEFDSLRTDVDFIQVAGKDFGPAE